MNVYVWGEEVFGIQLDKWGQLKECQSQKLPDSHHIQLLLNDDLPCGTTRVRNKITVSFLITNILNFLNLMNKKLIMSILGVFWLSNWVMIRLIFLILG